jgi:hypothetical protein
MKIRVDFGHDVHRLAEVLSFSLAFDSIFVP